MLRHRTVAKHCRASSSSVHSAGYEGNRAGALPHTGGGGCARGSATCRSQAGKRVYMGGDRQSNHGDPGCRSIREYGGWSGWRLNSIDREVAPVGPHPSRPRPHLQHRMIVETQCARFDSISLESGATLAPVEVAFQTYGAPDSRNSNAILVLHAFSGDAHAAGLSSETGKPGRGD